MTIQKKLAAILLGVSILAVTPGCGGEEDKGKEKPKVTSIPVETLIIAPRPFVDRIEVSGVTEPISEVTVSAEAPGRVLTAPFEEGEEIKKGKLLLRVDSTTNAAQIALLENQRNTAKREFERTKSLASQGLVTPQQMDQAAAQVDSANLGIKQARVGMGKTNVRSPIHGFVATKHVKTGEYVNPGSPLAHIVDYRVIKVKASVPESDIRYITLDREVEIYITALDRTVTGKVAHRAIVASPTTRTFPVEIHVANDDLSILPGMRARVIVPRKDWGSVVIVPRDAVLQGYQGREAMVLGGTADQGKAELRKIETGPASGNQVVIIKGVEAGERLIVKGHRSIVNGTSVRVVNEEKMEPAPGEEPAAPAQQVDNGTVDDKTKLADKQKN